MQRGLGDAIALGNRSGVVTLAGDGHVDLAGDVREVVLAVGDRVVGALGERLLAVLDGRRPLMGVAVVLDIHGAADAHAVSGVIDGASGDLERAGVLLDRVVSFLEALAGGKDNRVHDGHGGDLGHGAGRLDIGDLALDEAVARHGHVLGFERGPVIDLGDILDARQLDGALGDLIGHSNTTAVVTHTGNGDRHRSDVGSIFAIRECVVGTLD